jgi:hypothetical protein
MYLCSVQSLLELVNFCHQSAGLVQLKIHQPYQKLASPTTIEKSKFTIIKCQYINWFDCHFFC